MRHPDAEHLSTEELLRALDGELTDAQVLASDAHLAGCEECQGKIHELGVLSVRLESWVASVPVRQADSDRAALAKALATHRATTLHQATDSLIGKSRRTAVGPGLWHWAASAGVAAAVVIAAMLSPAVHSLRKTDANGTGATLTSQSFEIAGETFVALPYSNGDLPLSAPHIVQMEVPVTSLAEAGIVFEPVSSEQANPDRAVLADVLLGADGEPLGVHVLAGE